MRNTINKYKNKEIIEITNSVLETESIVSVMVITYNHINYIKQCLDGILTQETNFRFEILLGDDDSTDGTRELCIAYAEKFPNKIRLFLHHRENNIKVNGSPTGRFNFLYNLYNARGKYIALCEGDDYWTDPLKLQKQVDFLEANKEFGICWTNYKILQSDIFKKPAWDSDFFEGDFKEIDFTNFSSPYCTYTLTCLFKKECITNTDFSKFNYFKDNVLYSLCLQKSKGAILNFYGAVYRLHPGGIYSSGSEYFQALSNFSSYSEILKQIPKSRVQNIISKQRYWKDEFFNQLKKQPITRVKRHLIWLKFYFQFELSNYSSRI